MRYPRTPKLTYSRLTTIPGWLSRTDYSIMRAVLDLQSRAGITGHALEIGAYEGRSAIAIASGLGPGECLHVCDPFEPPPNSLKYSNDPTNYKHLARANFEANFMRWNTTRPEIYQCLSSDLADRLAERQGQFRLVHVDGSHTYEDVRSDLQLAKSLLCSGGVVVADDYRQLHTPGVAAATWQAVATGLRPMLLSPGKFYGSWAPDDTFVGLLSHAVEDEHCSVNSVTMGPFQVLY